MQVNGKLRSHIHAPFGTPADAIQAMALEETKVRPYIDGQKIVKVIVVPDKLMNIVVKAVSRRRTRVRAPRVPYNINECERASPFARSGRF